MLHLALPAFGGIRPIDWGAVVEFPDAWRADAEMQRLFGMPVRQLLGSEFKIRSADHNRCRPLLIRVGGVCDHAQSRSGPLQFILTYEIPNDATRTQLRDRDAPLPMSAWQSPIFGPTEGDQPFHLIANCRFMISLSPASIAEWTVRYRVREQLMTHLIAHSSAYNARPGIIQLPT
jgi:hypothetical protein